MTIPAKAKPLLLGLAAYSGTGKTTLLCKLLPLLKQQGLRSGVIKNTHHDVEIDKPGKDSFKIRQAGATQILLTSPQRWALVTETGKSGLETPLEECLSRLDTDNLDIVLVEGFKNESFPKIELHRVSLNKPFLFEQDDNIIAIAIDESKNRDFPVPALDINNAGEVCAFILGLTGKPDIK